jgi:hypothetical protein
MLIKKREKFIPLLSIKELDKGDLKGESKIYNGKFSLRLEKGEVGYKRINWEGGSTPLQIEYFDSEGKSYLKKDNKMYSFVINNFNELAEMPEGATEVIYSGPNRATITIDLEKNYERINKAAIEREFGLKLLVKGDTKYTNEDLKKIRDILRSVPKETVARVPSITLMSYEELKKVSGNPGYGAAAAYPDTYQIIMGKGNLDEATLQHELAHVKTYIISKEGSQLRTRELYELNKEYEGKEIGESTYKIKKEQIEEKYKIFGTGFLGLFGTESAFQKKWSEIAGDIYEKKLGRSIFGEDYWKIYEEKTKMWDTLKDDGSKPLYGFVRAYGATNEHEDIATIVELYYSDPQRFKRFLEIDETGKLKQKVKLLQEYGFFKEMVIEND